MYTAAVQVPLSPTIHELIRAGEAKANDKGFARSTAYGSIAVAIWKECRRAYVMRSLSSMYSTEEGEGVLVEGIAPAIVNYVSLEVSCVKGDLFSGGQSVTDVDEVLGSN